MLMVIVWSIVMSMVIFVHKLWVMVMMLLPVMLATVVREVSRDWSTDTLLSGSCELIVAVIVLLAIIKGFMY